MQYLLPEELDIYVPDIDVPADIATRRQLARAASKIADGAVRRPLLGMEVRSIIGGATVETGTNTVASGNTAPFSQIPLDLNYTGQLQHDPFVRWLDTPGFPTGKGKVIVPGTFSVQEVVLEDFDVDNSSGIIRYHRLRLGGNFPRTTDPYQGWWGETLAPYHVGSETQVDANECPYMLTASYRAGFFTVININSAAASGTNTIELSDVSDIYVGKEFYFSTDYLNDPDTETRYITAIDTNTRIVTYSPATPYAITTAMKFRVVDSAVKQAVGFIIADLLTYPFNTNKYHKALGRNAIVKTWSRTGKTSIPGAAMDLLSDYMR